jgi:hypothetical protein
MISQQQFNFSVVSGAWKEMHPIIRSDDKQKGQFG